MSHTKWRVLDVGCGKRKEPGAVGVDRRLGTAADVVADAAHVPWPFKSDTFDRIVLKDVLEHLDDVVSVVEEIHRVARPGAEVFVRVPHFSSAHAYGDVTHRRAFSTESFGHFTGGFPQYDFYSKAKFSLQSVRLNLWKLHRATGVAWIANRVPHFYEKYGAFIFPAMNVEFLLRVEKGPSPHHAHRD